MRRSKLLLLSLLIVAACGRREHTTGGVAAAGTTPQEGGTIIRRLDSDVNTLNPLMQTSAYEKEVLSNLFDPLVDYDQNLNVIPAVATKWDISPDGKLYTFYLNPESTFDDGTPVLATDVLFTIRKIVDPKSEAVQVAGLFEGLDLSNTKVIDDRTVQVGFKNVRAGQLLAFNIPVLPEHVYGKGDFRNDFNNRVVGNGPYKFVSRSPGKEIVLQRRDDYRRKKPYVQRIIFKVIADDTVAWNAMKRGDIDETKMTSDQWRFEKDNPQVQQKMNLLRFYYLSYNFIPWNTRDPLLSDKRVRRALAMCLDRRSIINNIYFGTARIITGPFTPDQWAYNPDVPAIEYDPAGARRVFASLGWNDSDGDGILDKDGKKFEFEMLIPAGNKASAEQGQIFQAGLKTIGITMNLTKLDTAAFLQRVMEGKFQASMLGWDLDVDPDVYALFHSSQFPPNGQNIVYYSNPEADRLIVAARQELDFAKRVELYHQIHALIADDQPYTWTVQSSTKWAVNKRVQNVEISKGFGLYLWYPSSYDWWIPASMRTHDTRGR